MRTNKKADFGGCAPFAGSGKLTDYKEKGSWMMNQIEKGYDKVERGISVDRSGDHIKFAKKINRIASSIVASNKEVFKIIKQYNKTEKNTFALKVSVTCTLDGSTLNELSLVRELLITYCDKDRDLLYRNFDFNTINVVYMSDACIDIKNKCIKCESIIKVEDNKKVKQFQNFLKENGFEEVTEK